MCPPAGLVRGEILHLFSGELQRRRSVARYASDLGSSVCEVDIIGGADICDDAVFDWLLGEATAGAFKAAIASVPCQSFSVLRVTEREQRGRAAGALQRKHARDSTLGGGQT